MASSSSLSFISPCLSTGKNFTLNPIFSIYLQVSRTAGCSIAQVMMLTPFLPLFSLLRKAIPLIARLSDSVPPDVKIISSGSAPRMLATCSLDFSTASDASLPKE